MKLSNAFYFQLVRRLFALTVVGLLSQLVLAADDDGSASAKAGMAILNSTILKDREPLSEYPTAEDRARQRFRDLGRKLGGGKPLCVASPSREQGMNKACGFDKNAIPKWAYYNCRMVLQNGSCDAKCTFDSCVPDLR